jgi:Zn-dependent peptidase ImmA (M78 family)
MPATQNITDPRTGVALTPGQIIAKFQTEAPVNVVSLAEELGLKVWESRTLAPNISGKIFKDPINGGSSGFSIVVNATENFARKRFTIAHEIAHFLLHRRQLDKGELIDDTMYRSGLSTREEADANKLAAQILMPQSLIQSLISSGVRDVEGLAKRLQVSIPAMKIRLGIPSV